MLTAIHPKLPMRDKSLTKEFYSKMEFEVFGKSDYKAYLMLQRDKIQLHFFEFRDLNPKENYGQVYIRTDDIEELYNSFLEKKIKIHPSGKLETKFWGQIEFSILDPNNNLLTFGRSI